MAMPDYLLDPRIGAVQFAELKKFLRQEGVPPPLLFGAATKFALISIAETRWPARWRAEGRACSSVPAPAVPVAVPAAGGERMAPWSCIYII